MTYAHRKIHDADGHIMELPEWLYDHADPKTRERLSPINVATVAPGEARTGYTMLHIVSH